ncbi:sigma factor-like helix-turn-helix DNA-binding protein [Mycobacterium intracellulare]|uniref:sigma factor-like helix-turn-helix DNA-binding protein n=1 Tax=Mycobacterium intracellulare TaxID=1767 RepID=UPI0015CB3C72|nr:sigma factor-like helix-turn-helix DNA-binding protein [Mycobacterium intracellulare]
MNSDNDSRMVLGDNLADLAAMIDVIRNGCWIPTIAGSVPCRVSDDHRPTDELPTFKPHRWAWLVAHDLAHDPARAASIQLRRTCGTKRCCNPQHVYATKSTGEVITDSELSTLMGSEKSFQNESSSATCAQAVEQEVSEPGPVQASTDQVAEPDVAAVAMASPPDTTRIVVANGNSPILGHDLDSVAALCDIAATGCWVAPTHAPVACQAEGDERDYRELPRMAPHRWTWMIAHGRSQNPLPGNMFHIRRRCGTNKCCNPDHLYLTAPDGEELSLDEAETWIRSGKKRWQDALDKHVRREPQLSDRKFRLVLRDDLESMADLCGIDESGCWIAPTAGPVACRASGDDRDYRDLPFMAPHRWTWMIANGRSRNPLPGNMFHVRRRCGKDKCCKPDHLYLTAPDGEELSLNDAEARWQDAIGPRNQPENMAAAEPTTASEVIQLRSRDSDEVVHTSDEDGLDVVSESHLSADLVSDNRTPRTWIEAFPWLKGAAEPASTPWWTEPIDEAGTVTRDQRLSTISDLAMKHLTRWTIGEIFPGLPADLALRNLDRLSMRARNVLGRERRIFTADLTNVGLDSILGWRQVGVETVDAILQALADASTWIPTPMVTANRNINDHGDSSPYAEEIRSDWIWTVVDDLTHIATWYSAVGFPSQPLIDHPVPPGTPDKIIEAQQRLQALRPSDVLSAQESALDLARLFDDALSVLDRRAIDVLSERLFGDEPLTLDQLGQKHGLTRERIRQIEGKARGTMMSAIAGAGPLAMVAASARDLIGTIRPLDDLLELMPALGKTIERLGQPVWRVLDRLDDAYEIEDGWCVVPTMTASQEFTRTQLQERATQYGVIRLDELDLVESSHPERRPDLTASWLTHCGYVIQGEFALTRTSTVGDYAAAILCLEGSPLSSQQIVDRFVVDRSVRSLSNALSADDRFDRVDRDRWALREWGMEAYTSIRTLIRELVAKGGGRVRLNDVVEHITAKYSVSGSSVIAYAAAAPFMTKNGVVQLGGERTARKTAYQTRRMFRRPDGWAYRVRITTDHLRGSGSVAPMSLTTILDLHEGETVQLDSGLGPQTIAWTGIQPSFGTIRRFLLDDDVAAGTEAFLVIHDDHTFGFEKARELVGEPLSDALTLIGATLTTDPEIARVALATAIGLPQDAAISSIIGDYRIRGDDDVADLVLAVREYLEADHTPAERAHSADVDEILDLL